MIAKGLLVNHGESFKAFVGIHDLIFSLHIFDAPGFEQPRVMHERGQDAFCADHGVRAMEDV